MTGRIGWVDSWKGLLILLVVFGHVVGMLVHYSSGVAQSVMAVAYKEVYLFHMPAFFLLVGVVDRLRGAEASVSFGVFVRKRARRLIVPYVLWGGVSMVVFWAASRWLGGLETGASDGYYHALVTSGSVGRQLLSLIHAGGWPNGEGFRCNSVLWFLPCMFLTLCFFWPARKLVGWQAVALAAALFLLGGIMRFFVGPLPWGFDRVPRFLALAMLGRWLGGIKVGDRWRCWPAVWLLASLGYLFLAVHFPDLGLCWKSWRWYFAEIGMAIWGSLAALGAARFCDGRFLRACGVASIGIMVIHKFPLVAVQLTCSRMIPSLDSVWMESPACTVMVATLLTIAVATISLVAARLTHKLLF